MSPTFRYPAFLAFTLTIAAPGMAMADHLDAFVQLTCTPGLSYFAIRTFHVWDTDAIDEGARGAAIRDAIRKDGVFTLEDFAHKSFHCALPSHDISFEVAYHPGGGGRVLENVRIEFRVDKKSVYSFDAYSRKPKNGFFEYSVHEIEFPSFDNSQLLDCTHPEEKLVHPEQRLDTGGEPVNASCYVIKF